MLRNAFSHASPSPPPAKGEQNSHNETMRCSLFSADCLLRSDFRLASGKLNIQSAMYWTHYTELMIIDSI